MKKKLMLLLMSLGIVSTAVFAYSFDTNLPLAGKSIAGTKVQSETLFPVYSFALRVAAPDCQTLSITNTEVSKAKNNGKWEEVWTVKACTRTARIPIAFTEADGTTNYAIDFMNVKVAK